MKIVVKGMSAGYGSSEILKDIDLEIGSGEKVFIGGSNGSGKTTLLKVMSGLIPHKGTVTVDGKEISKMKRKEAAKLISLMPQTSEVYFPYTVRETVLLEDRFAAAADRALRGDEDLLQHELQRIHGLILQEDHRVKVAVPLADGVVERHDRDDRLRKRYDHHREDLELPGAVDLRGFDEAVGYARFEEGLGHEQIPYRQDRGKDDRPHGVDKMEAAHDVVERDEAAAEEHRDDEVDHERFLPGKILAAQRPAGRDRHDQRKDDRDRRVNDRVQIPSPHVAPLHDLGEALHRDAHRVQDDLAAQDRVRVGYGGNHDEIQRIQDDQGKQEEKEAVNNVEHPVAHGHFVQFFLFCHGRVLLTTVSSRRTSYSSCSR